MPVSRYLYLAELALLYWNASIISLSSWTWVPEIVPASPGNYATAFVPENIENYEQIIVG